MLSFVEYELLTRGEFHAELFAYDLGEDGHDYGEERNEIVSKSLNRRMGVNPLVSAREVRSECLRCHRQFGDRSDERSESLCRDGGESRALGVGPRKQECGTDVRGVIVAKRVVGRGPWEGSQDTGYDADRICCIEGGRSETASL